MAFLDIFSFGKESLIIKDKTMEIMKSLKYLNDKELPVSTKVKILANVREEINKQFIARKQELEDELRDIQEVEPILEGLLVAKEIEYIEFPIEVKLQKAQ